MKRPHKPFTPPEYVRFSQYAYVYCYERRKWIAEHRAVWEEANGPIPDGYVIHHLNGIKTDNRIENLEMLTMNEHHRNHLRSRSSTDDSERADPLVIKCPPAVAGWRTELDGPTYEYMNSGRLSTDWDRVRLLAGVISFPEYREAVIERKRQQMMEMVG